MLRRAGSCLRPLIRSRAGMRGQGCGFCVWGGAAVTSAQLSRYIGTELH